MRQILYSNLASLSTALSTALVLLAVGCGHGAHESTDAMAEMADAPPHVMAASSVDAGRYLAIIAGCNDCHTPGYLASGGQVPEEDWFTGSIVGWRGPWGTSYSTNLRLRASEMSEDEWVDTLHYRTDLPPMPWMNLNQITALDARAIYRYIHSLGPKGEHTPTPLPPGEEPTTPYISVEPQNMEAMPGGPPA